MTVTVADDVKPLKVSLSRKLTAMTAASRPRPQVTDATGRQVAANVRRIREARGWSTYDLARVLESAGRPIAPSAIAKVERAERRVDAGDLTALAAALKVNPSALLLPFTDSPAEVVEITGVGTVGADAAWDWLDGEMPIERVVPGDPEAILMQFQVYARPPGRRVQLVPPGDD
ncbi:helix-turn-helix transcriptional regulator [Streptomyces sp. SID8499]|uniref:helix-turn-helix domain-containing protein n=1 Tax=Streptomyces sp. SID8499 TaxID=2706106 RepID=UPI0013CB073A|nr:helix-turn-helix transcriptional regulator [Streptomyces sp. SID8499]NED31963.1 helix-turn-helix transcriptional regulator [Streptomyces sp. SID8499]